MAKGPSTPTTDPGMTSDDGELEITPTAVQLNMQVEPIWNDYLWRFVRPFLQQQEDQTSQEIRWSDICSSLIWNDYNLWRLVIQHKKCMGKTLLVRCVLNVQKFLSSWITINYFGLYIFYFFSCNVRTTDTENRLDCGKSSEILWDSNNVRLQLLTPGLIYYGDSYFDVSHLSRTFL